MVQYFLIVQLKLIFIEMGLFITTFYLVKLLLKMISLISDMLVENAYSRVLITLVDLFSSLVKSSFSCNKSSTLSSNCWHLSIKS